MVFMAARSIKCHYCGPAGVKCNSKHLPVIHCNSNNNNAHNMLNLLGFKRSNVHTYSEKINLRTFKDLNFDEYSGALLVGLNLEPFIGDVKNLSRSNYHCISLTQG